LADGSQSLTKGISNADDYLEIYFNPTVDILDPKIVINLPSQIAYNAKGGFKQGPGNESSVEIDKITGSNTITISFKGTLLENEAVHLLISMKADCSASPEDDPEVSVQIKAGNEKAGIITKAAIGIKEPTISGSFRIPDDVDIEQDIEAAIHYDIKSTGGETSALTLTFKTKEVIILSDFMIGAKKIEDNNLSSIGPDDEGNVVYILELNEDLMGGRLDGTGKTIDMNATLLRCGINEILHDITSACGKTFKFPNYPIVIKGSSEKPNIVHVSSLHLKTHDPNNVANNVAHPTANNGLYPSMEDVSWIRSIFENDSETKAYSIAAQFDRYSAYSYFDIENAYYVIREAGGSNPIKGVLQNVKKTASVGAGSSNTGVIKGEYRDKPAGFSAAIQKEHFIPAGGTIEFFIPTYNGNIYDNTIKSDLFYDYPNTTIGGFNANITNATNACGDVGTFDRNTVRLAWMGVPHFREMPTGINFDGTISEEKTVRLRISAGNIPQGITSAEVVVYKPTWLTITDARVMGIDNNEVSGMSAIVGSNGTNQTVTLSRSNGTQEGNCFVELKYISTPTDGSESETIRYEMDFVSNITGTRMKNVFRVSQPVSMTKGEEVALTSFKLQRRTLGLAPDNSSQADPQKIRSDIYMAGDKGQLIWEATLLNDGYKHLYLTLDASNTELVDNVIIDGTMIVSIERGSTILTDATAVFTGGYIHCNYAFEAGDLVTLTTNFITSSSFNKKHFFISKCYVSEDALEKPLEESANRKGNDIRYAECGVYSLDMLYSFSGTSANYFSFSDNSEHTLYYGYYRPFNSQMLYSPYFSDEIRNLSWPKQIILTAPEGYTIKKIIVQKSGSWSPNMAHEQVEVGISSRSGNEYTFNLESLYGPGGWEKPNASGLNHLL